MSSPDWIARYDRSARRIIGLGSSWIDETVPSCPEWTGRDLVAHIGGGPLGWSLLMETPAGTVPHLDVEALKQVVPAGDKALVPWALDTVSAYVDRLSRLDPSAPAWSWTTDQTAGFWMRRAAAETAIHLWDAEGWDPHNRTAIPASLAADGLDELAASYRVLLASGQVYPPPLVVRPTDVADQWTLCAPDLASPEDEEVREVRGTASDLLLRLWRRDTGTFSGDPDTLDRWAGVNPQTLAAANF
jgi:uncharacterized protein (TIGR03083 family)